MSPLSKSTLSEIYNREIKFLIDGIKNSNNPYHFFYLSTFSKNSPHVRTVVLRNISKNPLKIYFNADARSPKVSQLLENPECSILFYDNSRRLQLRFYCKAKVHNKNNSARIIWDSTPLQSRKCYMGSFSPSEKVDKYEPNIPIKYLKSDPSEIDSEKGYKNFTSIELEVFNSDILELHHNGHIRFNLDLHDNISFVAP